MVGSILVAAHLVLAAVPRDPVDRTPNISGGTAEQQQKLQNVYNGIPDCWKKCGKNGKEIPIRIRETEKNEWPNAFYNHDPASIRFTPSLVNNNDRAEERYAYSFCEENDNQAGIDRYLSNLQSWTIHELAHHQDFGCNPGEKKSFLKLRYRAMNRNLQRDREYQRLTRRLAEIWSPRNDASQAEKHRAACRVVEQMDDILNRHDVPQRHGNDTHALDGNGAEYFAIAIQTAIWNHGEFCSTFSRAEMDWLADHYGSCLRKFNSVAPCLFENARSSGTPARTLGK